jgi:hypothetical protein
MALRSTQPLTEMSTRNLPGGKGRPVHGADNLTGICEPTVWKCGSLEVSQPYGPSWPVKGTSFNVLFPCNDYHLLLVHYMLVSSILVCLSLCMHIQTYSAFLAGMGQYAHRKICLSPISVRAMYVSPFKAKTKCKSNSKLVITK